MVEILTSLIILAVLRRFVRLSSFAVSVEFFAALYGVDFFLPSFEVRVAAVWEFV